MPTQTLDGLWPLHMAIVSVLATDAAVVAALGTTETGPAIYSARPPDDNGGNIPIPRLVLGPTTGGSLTTFGTISGTPSVQVDVWAEGPGFDRVLPLCGHVCRALGDTMEGMLLPTPEEGWPYNVALRAINVLAVTVSALMDQDRQSMHGVVRCTSTIVPA